MLNQFLNLTTYNKLIVDKTVSLLNVSQEKSLKAKQSSNEVSNIHAQYGLRREVVRDKLSEITCAKKDLTGKTDAESKAMLDALMDEYDELKIELEQINAEENEALKRQEEASTAYEIDIDQKQTTLETQIEATKKDRDSLKESLKTATEECFKYFG